MGEIVGYKVREGVAIITVDNPPINALSQPVREGLRAAVVSAIDDDAVSAIVIQAEGRTFPAGADLRDFHARIDPPSLGEVCRLIEDSPKPVLAAIHGTALGGGLELALACHFRLAHAEAQLGLPDVALGAVPSAGGSQRLPRIVGARTALDMLISARPISAEGAARIGLVDKVVQKNLARAALGSARNMASAGTVPRPTRACRDGFSDPSAYLAAIDDRREALAGDAREAVQKAVDLVEAALILPFDAGLELERVSYEDLVESDQARGLRHAFLAERRTTRDAALAPAHARPVARIGVVGSGPLALSLVHAALASRRHVVLYEADEALRDRATGEIEADFALAVEVGDLDPAQRDAELAKLTAAAEPEALAPCDVIVEAVEDGDPQAVVDTFARIGAVADGSAMLASATARDPAVLEARAAASGRHERVVGLVFSEPFERSRLVEVQRLGNAAEDLGATAVAFAQSLGRVPVVPARPGAGIVATMSAALWSAALWLVDEGAAPPDVDAALVNWGFAEGPFVMMDRIGLDRLGLDAPLVDRMIAAGWSGAAVGRGFYAHGEAAEPGALAPGVAELIASVRKERGISARDVAPDEITARVLGALAATGARLVAQGVAARPSDVDVALVLGFGFPRWRGGPMEAADLGGLLKLRNRLRTWAEARDGALWHPVPLFDELIKNGRGFDVLNR